MAKRKVLKEKNPNYQKDLQENASQYISFTIIPLAESSIHCEANICERLYIEPKNNSKSNMQTTNKFLCSFQGFRQLHEVKIDEHEETNEIISMRLNCTRALPAPIKCLCIGRSESTEILFASFYDHTMRAFTIERDSLLEHAQIRMNSPGLLLWEENKSRLLVSEWSDEKNTNRNVTIVTNVGDTNDFQVESRAFKENNDLLICAWADINNSEIYSFNYKTKELAQILI